MRPSIHSVVVDRKILDGFKRRALKQYPKEYAEQLWGTVEGSKANICVIEPVDLKQQTRDEVDFDFDQRCGTEHSGMILLGSIHTHPAPYERTEPSADDISSSIHDQEIVWGSVEFARNLSGVSSPVASGALVREKLNLS
jgi:proteasome lid subunit RPN8/RPN11